MAIQNDTPAIEAGHTPLSAFEVTKKALNTHEANTNPLIQYGALLTLERIQNAVSLLWHIEYSDLSDTATCGLHGLLVAIRDALQFEMDHRAALESMEKDAEEAEAQAKEQQSAVKREREHQESLKPENLLSMAEALAHLSRKFASGIDEALKQKEAQA